MSTQTQDVSTIKSKVQIEDIGPCRKKLAIEIPAEKVSGHLTTTLDDLSRDAVLPGFRRGKAPRHLVERRFGTALIDDARQKLISEAYGEVVKEHELRVLGEPTPSEDLSKLELAKGKPLSFSLEIEVAPEFDLPELESIEVKKPIIEIADELVDQQIERIATNEGELEPREKAEEGDYCVGHGVLRLDKGDEQVLDIPGAVIQVPTTDKEGRGMILGVMVDDFAKQIGKPKPGDKLVVKTTGPEQHENESIRGEAITIEFDVEEVHRVKPASIEALLSKLGIENEQHLREGVMLRLNQRAQIEQIQAMRRQVAQHLLENVEFELPKRLTENQAARNLERARLDMMYRGVEANEIEEHVADLRAASAERAVRELKLFFILDRVATELNVEITEGEVNGRIAQIAAQRGERPEKLRTDLFRSGAINGVAQQIREHKALDALLAKAKVEDMPVDDFNAFMRSQMDDEDAGAKGGKGKKSKK